MKISELKKQKIAILGLSQEGVSSAEFLFRHQIPFTVFDMQNEKTLSDKKKFLSKWKSPSYFGHNYLNTLDQFSFIIRSPGVPLFTPELLKAKDKGAVISSNTKLFMELSPTQNSIGVTGTKGKGTTCKLIESVFKKDYRDVYVGGNIGQPPLDFIDKLTSDSWVILELSSFQLEDFEKSPHMAIVLGLAPDHLAPESKLAPNYHQNYDNYLEAKKNLVRFQNVSDFVVLKKDDENALNFIKETNAKPFFYSRLGETKRGGYVESGKLKYKNEKLIMIGNIKEVQLRGKHHLENICAALTACGILDCATNNIRKGLFGFAGYEHRLELVGAFEGVTYYNDSAATNPEPTMAAINAFSEPIILIVGGSDKGQSYEMLGRAIVYSTVKVVYLIGEMADKIAQAILSAQKESQAKKVLQVIKGGTPSMEKIATDCIKLAQSGDVVLLSPACASFDMFKNYRQRGDLFKSEISKQGVNHNE